MLHELRSTHLDIFSLLSPCDPWWDNLRWSRLYIAGVMLGARSASSGLKLGAAMQPYSRMGVTFTWKGKLRWLPLHRKLAPYQ